MDQIGLWDQKTGLGTGFGEDVNFIDGSDCLTGS